MRQIAAMSRNPRWRELYLAALFENDKANMLAKIPEAQYAIAARRSELLNTPAGDSKEIHALDNALFSLQALRDCLVSSAIT